KKFLTTGIEKLPEGTDEEPTQTLAFQRVLQRTALHVQSAGKEEAGVGDALAALLQEGRSHAARLLEAEGVTRLDVLNYVSPGMTRLRGPPAPEEPVPAGDAEEEAPRRSSDALGTFAVNLTDQARQGLLDPLVGREKELRRALEVLCRRRKNN